MTNGGEGISGRAVSESNIRRTGWKHSDEAKKTISLSLTGKECPDYKKINISKSLTGYKHSLESCKNMGKSRLGKKRGPYKISPIRTEAQKAADLRRVGVKRGPYRKKQKEHTNAD
jgi:hypothetical protein